MGVRSYRVAMGGLASALALLFMFMTGMIPFATYVLPAFAGIILIAIVVDLGRRWATMVYIAISLLSLLITPDKESTVLFIFFFGYYPIIKTVLEHIKPKVLRFLTKLSIFNLAVIGAYMVIIYVLMIPDMLEEFGDFGRYSVLIMLIVGNITFVVYDFAVGNIYEVYTKWFKPKFLRRRGSK